MAEEKLEAKAFREKGKHLTIVLHVSGKDRVASFDVARWSSIVFSLMAALEVEFDLCVVAQMTVRTVELTLMGMDGEKIAASDEPPTFYEAWVNGWLAAKAETAR